MEQSRTLSDKVDHPSVGDVRDSSTANDPQVRQTWTLASQKEKSSEKLIIFFSGNSDGLRLRFSYLSVRPGPESATLSTESQTEFSPVSLRSRPFKGLSPPDTATERHKPGSQAMLCHLEDDNANLIILNDG